MYTHIRESTGVMYHGLYQGTGLLYEDLNQGRGLMFQGLDKRTGLLNTDLNRETGLMHWGLHQRTGLDYNSARRLCVRIVVVTIESWWFVVKFVVLDRYRNFSIRNIIESGGRAPSPPLRDNTSDCCRNGLLLVLDIYRNFSIYRLTIIESKRSAG